MKFASLFPYANRALGLSEFKVEKAEQCSPVMLAKILLSNLKAGDILPLSKYTLTVISNDELRLVYRTASNAEHGLSAEDIWQSPLFNVIVKELQTWAPAYQHPLCLVLERDPAVFRLRDSSGWVVNDALCLSSGNVSYPLLVPDAAAHVKTEPEAPEVEQDEIVSLCDPEQRDESGMIVLPPDEKTGQYGFGF